MYRVVIVLLDLMSMTLRLYAHFIFSFGESNVEPANKAEASETLRTTYRWDYFSWTTPLGLHTRTDSCSWSLVHPGIIHAFLCLLNELLSQGPEPSTQKCGIL